MANTDIRITIESIVSGTIEGGSANNVYRQSSTAGVRVSYETTFGAGIANATTIRSPVAAKFMSVFMPTTNASGVRLSISTVEVGIPLSSQGASLWTIPASTGGTEYYFYSTSTRAVSGARVAFH